MSVYQSLIPPKKYTTYYYITNGEDNDRARAEVGNCKLAMIRKWLNMAALQSKIICGLFLQSSLILAKFTASSKLLLKNKLDMS